MVHRITSHVRGEKSSYLYNGTNYPIFFSSETWGESVAMGRVDYIPSCEEYLSHVAHWPIPSLFPCL